MKKLLLLLCTALVLIPARAQVPDDTNGRLYLLCKTWGYLKYFNQHKCGLPWDELLNETIGQVLAAGSNVDFNAAMLDFLNQAGNNVAVANPVAMPDTNLNFRDDWIRDPVFSQPVRNFLETYSKHIYPDQTDCLIKTTASSIIDFTNDRITIPIDYTNEANRLTVMFYYWNTINYFSPYRSIMDQPWDSTLQEFIPVIRLSGNSTSFKKSLLKLVTHINDTHAAGGSIVRQNPIWGGDYVPNITFLYAENQCVVTNVNLFNNVSVGDVLLAINQVSMQKVADSLAMYIPASTPAAFYREMYKYMLRGARDTWVNLTFRDRDNQTFTVRTKRTELWGKSQPVITTKSYYLTDCGYGYVNMGKLVSSEVPAMYDSLKNAPAIIFDIRNYPDGTVSDIAKLLFQGPITSAVYYWPALKWYSMWNYLPGWYYKLNDSGNFGTWFNENPYKGKVILLVNQESQSHSEFTCQYLSYYPGARVIGTQTAGADGNVANLILPGGLTSVFTSLGWYYADGYQQQRNGVKIDRVVKPTIQGIRNGEDEILMAALDCLSATDVSAVNALRVLVYPNPVTGGKLNISVSLAQNSDIKLSLIDLTGRSVLMESRLCMAGEQTLTLDLGGIAPGIYMLNTRCREQSSYAKIRVD